MDKEIMKGVNYFYLITGTLLFILSIVLIYYSFYFGSVYESMKYSAVIDKANNLDDIKALREFLIENIEYQKLLEQHRINSYLYAGVAFLYCSILFIVIALKCPNKALKRDAEKAPRPLA